MFGKLFFGSAFWSSTVLQFPRRKTDHGPDEPEPGEVRPSGLGPTVEPKPVSRRGTWHFRPKSGALDSRTVDDYLARPTGVGTPLPRSFAPEHAPNSQAHDDATIAASLAALATPSEEAPMLAAPDAEAAPETVLAAAFAKAVRERLP